MRRAPWPRLLAALAVAHRAGIVHRDVKPSNVFLTRPAGVVKLLDFGVAKLLAAGTTLTATGSLLGTPSYMAPEQLRAEGVGARTDLRAVARCVSTR